MRSIFSSRVIRLRMSETRFSVSETRSSSALEAAIRGTATKAAQTKRVNAEGMAEIMVLPSIWNASEPQHNTVRRLETLRALASCLTSSQQDSRALYQGTASAVPAWGVTKNALLAFHKGTAPWGFL